MIASQQSRVGEAARQYDKLAALEKSFEQFEAGVDWPEAGAQPPFLSNREQMDLAALRWN
ncbi:MAG: hypothetical protein KA117_00015 [Verrucomicrobia bacterium]|jgi:hypothetical protein|nr:hypothetical protein [Verrucomicrobiota bacterium]HOX63868.1 hypothetical protein [Verrucomicrobiota bacterium]HPW91789.1 hypothetical protein [Verrucomicrobiota bacterium]HQB72502.1 hypothetical protein [Verrucomicrobiota bacterium]